MPEVSRTEGWQSDSVEEMKCSPSKGGKLLKTPWLATCLAHKACRKPPWLLRSGQKDGHGVSQLGRSKKAADETEFSSGKERSLVPAPCCLLMFFKKAQQSNASSFPTTTPNNKKAQICWTRRGTNVSTSLENTPEACGHPAFLRRLQASSPACLPSRAASSRAPEATLQCCPSHCTNIPTQSSIRGSDLSQACL